MRITEEKNIVSSKFQSRAWLVLLIGAILHIPLSLPGITTQIAGFDIILPILAGWTLWIGRLAAPSRQSTIILTIILSSIVLHSLGIGLLKSEFQAAWLIKETLKAAVITIEFGLLLLLFLSKDWRLPSVTIIGWIFLVTLIALGFLGYLMLSYERFFFARTVYCVALTGLYFLLASDGTWVQSGRKRALLLLAGILVAVVAVLLLSKAIAGLALAMAVWIGFGGLARRLSASHIATWLCGLAFATAIGVAAAILASNTIDDLGRMDSIERSVTVRLKLWQLGFEAFWQSMPWGLGLGQFWEIVVTDYDLAKEGHRYVHSTFIGLLTELGILGLILSIGLIVILCTAARGWPPMVRPLFFLLVFTPLTIHDGHSIRMLLIVTALGLARYMAENQDRLRRTG